VVLIVLVHQRECHRHVAERVGRQQQRIVVQVRLTDQPEFLGCAVGFQSSMELNAWRRCGDEIAPKGIGIQ
jgi:hypothetical protein